MGSIHLGAAGNGGWKPKISTRGKEIKQIFVGINVKLHDIYVWNQFTVYTYEKKCELIFYSTRDGGDAQLQ